VSLGLLSLKQLDHVFPIFSPSTMSIADTMSLFWRWDSFIRHWISFFIWVDNILILLGGRLGSFVIWLSFSDSFAIFILIIGWIRFS